MGFPGGSVVKKKTHMPMQEVQFPSLEKEKSIHSSILAWEIPWTEGTWQATAHEVLRAEQDLATENKMADLCCMAETNTTL